MQSSVFNSIDTNPPNATDHITNHGSDWFWAVFAIMLFTDLVVFFWQFSRPRGQRVFHYLAMIILTTASVAYFSLASDLGSTPIAAEFAYRGYAVGTTRQIWYVRYIDWVVTTPCLLLELVLATGLPLSDIITLVFFDLVMIIVGLVGALVASSYKWGYFVFGMFAEFYILWVLLGPARQSAGAIGPEYKKAFTTSAVILIVLWLGYPISWGVSEGGNVLSPDGEAYFYGILDVLAKPVFIIYHLFQLSRLDLTRLQLSSGKFSSGAGAFNAYDAEHHAASANQIAGASNSGTPSAVANGGKTGLFSKRGRHDATPAAGITAIDNPPRHSETTVVTR